MIELESASPDQTEQIAAELTKHVGVGDVVTVSGELGSGKTTFIRGACRALGVTAPVTSPTFTLGNRYVGAMAISHLDLYRLSVMAEPDWAELEPYFEDAVVFVEWPEVALDLIGKPKAAVGLRHVGERHRLISVQTEDESLQTSLSIL